MRRAVAFVLAALAALLAVRGSSRPDPSPARGADTCVVSSVGDGDSFRCEPAGRRVRLLLVDAPELDQSPFGDSARVALRALLPAGTAVRLETDVRPTDDFGRALAYAWLDDGRMVNETLARSGHVVALVYPPDVRYAERIRAAVEEARAARRGLWATPAFSCLPRDFRARRCAP